MINTLIIECKKQEKKPWVFFEKEKPNTDFTSVCLYPKEAYSWLEGRFQNHCYYNQKPCAFHFPRFVKKGKSDVILEAINQVVDASLFTYEQARNHLPLYWFFCPVITLDGLLFSARVEINGKIRLNEVKYLQLFVTRGLMKPEKILLPKGRLREKLTKDIIIDIVRVDFLEQFLKNFR